MRDVDRTFDRRLRWFGSIGGGAARKRGDGNRERDARRKQFFHFKHLLMLVKKPTHNIFFVREGEPASVLIAYTALAEIRLVLQIEDDEFIDLFIVETFCLVKLG